MLTNRILFSKENVFVYPPEIEKGIKGTISICSLDKGSIYLCWIPDLDQDDSQNTSQDDNDNSNTNTMFNKNPLAASTIVEIDDQNSWVVRVHIKELKSIKKYTPNIGTPYIIITSRKGTAFFPFFFEHGGVREFLKSLSQIIHLKKSNLDSNFFTVVDFSDPVQRSLSSMNLSEFYNEEDQEQPQPLQQQLFSEPLSPQQPQQESLYQQLKRQQKLEEDFNKDLTFEHDMELHNQEKDSKYSLLSSTNQLKKAQEISVSLANSFNSNNSGNNSTNTSFNTSSNININSSNSTKSNNTNILSSSTSVLQPPIPSVSTSFSKSTNGLSLSSLLSRSTSPTSPIPIEKNNTSISTSPLPSPSTTKYLSTSVGSDNEANKRDSDNNSLSTSPTNKRALKREISSSIFDNFAKVNQLAKSVQKNIFEEPAKKIDNHFRNLISGSKTSSIGSQLSPQNPNNQYFDILNESTSSLNASTDYFTPFNISSSNFSIELGVNRRECNPLSPSEWYSYFDDEGRICLANQQILLKKIFYGGIDDSIRQDVWPFLLGFYSFDSTYSSREVVKYEKTQQYFTIKRQWESISCEQESRFSKYSSRKMLIRKDVIRTDRLHPMFVYGEDDFDQNPNLKLMNDILLTYSFFNFDIGYVQGMSDLLSPILNVMKCKEVESFWCFKGLMDRLESNFHKDQNGMHTQLSTLSKLLKFIDLELYSHLEQNNGENMYFFFQSILICFKREFSFADVKTLWEILWSNYLTKNIPIFMCLSILLKERNNILEENMAFDQILKLINEKSNKMNLEDILIDSESLVKYFIVKQMSINADKSLIKLKESISIY
ncbi:hypothetical protein DICPUDRAFT_89768 [Dictyostelium purpureum]|uniref:Rab-GAP TBC domain-containing protein n=1 Tax=Dictyostelium purpureum TaxID=5786 RepID=F0ZY35_DICPU|nr:uncharacterized protein DICPUDRAFT_89768 [Dictyostelium purpureum]EGC31138.1 hypothetical protein DICPUDRAFT_89768 [Dictyostelium purpureum]|eukprot:XP_003292326.1 hypothetical protein DICPUDRAFT_89768 [Dictyostelium purpureum]